MMRSSDPRRDDVTSGGATLAERAAVLFGAYRDGDEAGMAELVALLTPILWHTVRAQNVDHAAAEDVLQTTWLALIRNSAGISDPRAVLQWLIVTAKREAWRVVKAERRVDPQDFSADDDLGGVEPSPEADVVAASGRSRLWAHIQTLPDRCRELLRVIAFADRPDYASIATALGMPVGSIGPTRGRCLAKLRAQLDADPEWEY
jgi:RNA polymerase sigma factor (sigma-70 family)